MQYIKVSNSAVVGAPFTLAKNYVLEDGTIVTNVANLTAVEKVAIGLYPFVDSAREVWETVVAYTINALDVTAGYTAMPLADYKQQKIAAAYQLAKAIMDAQTEGYSQAEVATWPAIQADVVAYNVDNLVIGIALQAAADTSAYTIAELAAMLTPRITVQATAISDRATAVAAILAAVDHASV